MNDLLKLIREEVTEEMVQQPTLSQYLNIRHNDKNYQVYMLLADLETEVAFPLQDWLNIREQCDLGKAEPLLYMVDFDGKDKLLEIPKLTKAFRPYLGQNIEDLTIDLKGNYKRLIRERR